jgi:hypothetical protein
MAALTFGSVELTKSSMAMTVDVANTGKNATGTLSVSSSSGEFSASGCSGTIAAGMSCKLSVTFSPAQLGPRSGSIMISATPGGAVSLVVGGIGIKEGAVNITPPSATFPATAVGGTSAATMFTVTNPGGAAVMPTISISGEFTQSATTCMMSLPAGGTCTVSVVFKPTSGGLKTGSITVSAGGSVAAATLTGTGQEATKLEFAPATAMLSGDVGAEGGAVTLTLTNTGDVRSAAITFAIGGANMGDFVNKGTTCNTLAGGATCTVTVAMKATAAGQRMGTITATAGTGVTAVANLVGTAVPPGDLDIAPATGMFAATTVNDRSAAVSFTVTNSGGSASGAISASTSSNEFVIVANTCTGTLNAGGTCKIDVVLLPSSAGAKSAILTVSANPGGAATASLQGTANAPAGLSASPTAGVFGNVQVSSTSQPVPITITNNGGSATNSLTTAIEGASASQFMATGNTCMGQTLGAGATCVVTITFTPAGTGDKAATLRVTGGTPTQTVTVNLSGSGIGGPVLSFAPATAAFPQTPVTFTNPAPQVFIVTNSGMVDSGMIALTIVGTNAGDFEINSNGCTILKAGESCTVSVQFHPAATSVGPRNASLQGTASGLNGFATLTGTGKALLEITTPPNFPPGPSATDFGNVSVGVVDTDNRKHFSYTVRFPSAGAPTDVFTAGASDFTFVSDTCSAAGSFANINPFAMGAGAPGATTWVECTVTVEFDPKVSRGAKAGTLTTTVGAQSVTQAFSGTGVGPLQVTVSPGTLTTMVGTSSGNATFTVTNNGTVDITGLTTSFATFGADFAAVGGGSCGGTTTLTANGGYCTVIVRATGATVGTFMGTLTANGMVPGNTETASQAVTAVVSPIGPQPVLSGVGNLGNVPLTHTSVATLTITNPANATGNTPVIGTPTVEQPVGATFGVPGPGNTCVGTLASLPPGASCTFQVTMKPAGDVPLPSQEISSTVRVVIGGVTLVGTVSGVPVQSLSVSPPAVTFTPGGVPGDTTGGPLATVTVQNAGEAIPANEIGLALTNITAGAADDFQRQTGAGSADTCESGGIPAGGSCVLQYRFVPNNGSNGTYSATLSVTRNSGGNGSIGAQATLTGSQVGDGNVVWQGINNSPWNFGTVPVGSSSAPVTFTAKNTGGVATTLTAIPAAAGFVYAEGTTCWATNGTGGATLQAGDSCNVVLVYTPAQVTEGAVTQSLNVTFSKRVGVSGTSTPALSAQGVGFIAQSQWIESTTMVKGPFNLGQTFIGTATGATTLVYRNASGAGVAVGLTAGALTNGFEVVDPMTCGGGTVASGSSCNFTVRYNPAAPPYGLRSSSVTVGLATAGLYARTQHDAVLAVSMAPAGGGAFGDLLLGMNTSRTWTVTNNGDRAPGMLTLASSSGSFDVSGTCVNNTTLTPGASCTVIVTTNLLALGPPISDPPISGNITLAGSLVENGGGTFAVTTVTARMVSPALLVRSTDTLNFGAATNVGDRATLPVTISNRNHADNVQRTGPLTITVSDPVNYAVALQGGNCPFAFVVNGIPEDEECVLNVTFQPKSVGVIPNATLTVMSTTGGSVSVTLVGTSIQSFTISGSDPTAFTSGDPTESFTVTRTSTLASATSGPLNVTIGGTNPGAFTYDANTCQGKVLTDGDGTCTITIRFTGSGANSASLVVTGTAPGNTRSRALSGS